MKLSFIVLEIPIQSKSDLFFNTQSRVLQIDWLILENDEKATLKINVPFDLTVGSHTE